MIQRQIGWSNESNLLFQILKQIKRLTSTIANSTPTLQQVSDAGGFTNNSTLRQGSVLGTSNTNYGIALDSSGTELQWKNGVEYYFVQGSKIVHANSLYNTIPDNTYDTTKGWAIGSKYTNLVTGKTYVCTGDSTNNAVWNIFPYKSLQFTLDQEGNMQPPSFIDVFVNDDFGNVRLDWSWSYNGVGSYNLVADSAIFTLGKTFIFVSSNYENKVIECERRNENTIRFYSFASGSLQNDVIDPSFIFEIRIYP
jgi:hypothetical protein